MCILTIDGLSCYECARAVEHAKATSTVPRDRVKSATQYNAMQYSVAQCRVSFAELTKDATNLCRLTD